LKKDSGAAFLAGMLMTLMVYYLVSAALALGGTFPLEEADVFGVSVFIVLLWSFAWWNARRRSRLDSSSQAPR
jgi:hypothetical protein